ncbi:anti-sigma regulatory factor (Ser/Thr protein kinase) [Actinorugispora endophytica]|uniref:Anti-sigma regulatory factor (Ser/Thr protein kinase) n=1 Tax=Actinorugispora endophytica TaxID=1605990 RepID=A0A4R6V358_9ACTN|nr:anti-sigma regulatory factor (Ser/Thr protein kinase) [Actinorugispora endophytica]
MSSVVSSGAFSPVRWEPRIYEGSLKQAAVVRSHVRKDLGGFAPGLVDDVELCVSELFANAVEYTASGGEGGEVVRRLSLPEAGLLRVEVADGGFTDTRPTIPELAGDDWFTSERHRGLLMVSALAKGWGFYPVYAHPTLNLGLVVWAGLPVDPAQVPAGLPRFVHTA